MFLAATSGCSSSSNDEGDDIDRDGITDSVDNCPLVFNEDQIDTDSDGLGADINPDPGDSWLNKLTYLNGTLYFWATDDLDGNELWAYDPACK